MAELLSLAGAIFLVGMCSGYLLAGRKFRHMAAIADRALTLAQRAAGRDAAAPQEPQR